MDDDDDDVTVVVAGMRFNPWKEARGELNSQEANQLAVIKV